MAVVFYNVGVIRCMQKILDSTVPNINTFIFLFTNDVTPDVSDTITTYVGMTGGGGDAIQLNTHWDIVGVAGVATCTAAYGSPSEGPPKWTFDPYTGATTIYGWVVFDSTFPDFPIIFGNRLPTPYLIPEAGGALKINLEWIAQLCAA